MNRICFFSIDDLASSYYLNQIESRYEEIDKKDLLEINDFLELYNAKLYVDNKMFLDSWDEKKRKYLEKQSEINWQKIKSFFLQINSETLSNIYDMVDFQYKTDFWKLIDNLQVYKNISKKSFQHILITYPRDIESIMQHERLVSKFSEEIKTQFLSNPDSIEILLSEEDHSTRKSKYFLPKTISNIDKEKIINDYLDQDNPNLNYVSLIMYAKDTALKLSAKTKLKAKRVYEKKSNDLFNSDLVASTLYGVEVGTQNQKDNFIKHQWKGTKLKVTYDYDFFKNILSTKNLILIFQNLFHFTDQQGLITLISKASELTTMENIFMRSKNEYKSSLIFDRKDMISIGQLNLVNEMLRDDSISISDIFTIHLKGMSNFDRQLEKLIFKLPSVENLDEDKIRILAPALESFLRQYELYVSEGEIDFELLEISSKSLHFSDIKSRVDKKYLYLRNDPALERLQYILFSDQSMLTNVDPFKKKYDRFYDLLTNEDDIRYNNYKNYQKNILDKLIADDILLLKDDKFLKIKNENYLFVLSKLHENEVISYWHFPPTFREEMDLLVHNDLCYHQSSLFTKAEVTYLNYYLNKKEFTDGPDLRNKYLHGSKLNLDSNNGQDYLIYLRIVILCLLKIHDDLLLLKESTS